MTLETMLVGAQLRGLSISAFDLMNPGQIVDYCLEYNETVLPDGTPGEQSVREAGQLDFDTF